MRLDSPLFRATQTGDTTVAQMMDGWPEAVRSFLNETATFLKADWPDVKDFFNSVFFIAIAGSLAGAFAGARAAQRMADKGRNREELLKEIRAANAAIMVAFGICNNLLSAKKQHIKFLKETFDRDKLSTMEGLKKQQAGTGGVVTFLADYRTLQVLDLPTSILQTLIFEKLSVHGRTILLATTVAQTIESLNTCIKRRNELIEGFKTGSLPDTQALALYFGFSFGGRINEEYANAIEAIYRQTDDAIFFSSQLCNDLTRHGGELAASFKRRFGGGAPRIHKPIFSKAVSENLMPKESDYADWMSMFVKRSD